jgi:hypothetical protein
LEIATSRRESSPANSLKAVVELIPAWRASSRGPIELAAAARRMAVMGSAVMVRRS